MAIMYDKPNENINQKYTILVYLFIKKVDFFFRKRKSILGSSLYTVSLSLNFCIRSLFFLNGPQALYINLVFTKDSLGLDLSTTNKNVFTISFIRFIN